MSSIEITNKPLSFEEAINYFKDKIPLKPYDFYRIAREYKTKAFTVLGYTNLEILEKFMEELTKALEEGTTRRDFMDNMNGFLEKKGYEGLSNFQSDVIFRTNIQTAYSVGHYERMKDPAVKKLRPYWMYVAVMDKRTRDTHKALHGKVFSCDNTEIWNKWYPPNGFRCRCTVVTLSKRQMDKEGLELTTELPDMIEPPGKSAIPLRPDHKFDYNPAKNAWEPNISKFPKVLQEAYKMKNTDRL